MTFGSSYGQTFFVAIFNAEIRADYNLSHGEIGFYYSIATLFSAAVFAWVGGLVDTLPLKRFSALIIVGLASAGFLMSVSQIVPLLLFGFFGLRLAGQGLMTHVALTAAAKAFRRRRGTALSLISLGFPLGQASLPIIGVVLIEIIGWRSTWFVLSAALLFILLPAVLILLTLSKRAARTATPRKTNDEVHPEDSGVAHSHPSDIKQWTQKQVLKDVKFYLLQPALLAMPIIGTGIVWNITLIAESKTWSLEIIATSLSGLAMAQAVMTLLAGPMIDRFRALPLLPLSLLPMIGCLCLLAFSTSAIMVFPIMALLGISFGLVLPVSVAMWAELYGTQHLGAIRSLTQALAVFGTALSPVLMGLLTDWGVSIDDTALLLAAYACASVALAFMVSRRAGSTPIKT